MATMPVPQQDSRSDTWTWFVKCNGRKKAKCNLCGKDLAFHGGTTNLREHLSAKHPWDYRYKGKEVEVRRNLMCTRGIVLKPKTLPYLLDRLQQVKIKITTQKMILTIQKML